MRLLSLAYISKSWNTEKTNAFSKVKRQATIRNWYNQIPHLALKTKREITKYINWQQFTKSTRGKPNEQLFPKQVVIQLPKIYKIRHQHNSWTKV